MNQSHNVAASVRTRLKNKSTSAREDVSVILTRYTLERFLYRISQSLYKEQFILKGALLFSVWSDQPHRPTRDLDLLGRGNNTLSYLEQVFSDICQIMVPVDGLEFNPNTIKSQKIKEDQEYEGVRINLQANLAGTRTRIPVQIDIGFGDVVTPAPLFLEFPPLLDFPAPQLLVYPRETVVAEKFQAIVMLGIANSRLKDFYDLWFLSQNFEFEGKTLCQAIKTTFARRRTSLPELIPLGLTADFAEDKNKVNQWKAFVSKTKLLAQPPSLSEVVSILLKFLWPPTQGAAKGETFQKFWSPQGNWQEK
ncbi:nucleotidyl transferase AbiEii/AbiGii toxin family protein [Gloeocapsa sp. PCC 73106]|uniref:nucleotidyl transferase AbiEii/AbiGii toxin family protein n=1 Tax=Gloeocapsa sp. PCC 73106 TaxID=102232 RepID=UPI0002ACF9E2|nr:nucleotidyl transferase AbiEii/AbiGii toxin family protein [Gloeocapsa sp. PCC 73106]ELR99686.1 protein of unknown function (DUF1814) [Gloeocapsa sp. PCC 73106]